MKQKSLNFIIPLVVFPFDVMVSIGQSDEEFIASIKKYCPEDAFNELMQDKILCNMPDTVQARTINVIEGGQTIIRLKQYPKTPVQYGYLGHEIFHAATFIMDRMGIEFVLMKSDECFAYTIGYITTEIYKKL